ncbi:23S rRNA (guanosine(2251)-2'-O)-methyltransferase RlmB [Dokdonella fugitiva]|jgi:23S rRNA (guanosine2251-2'-O)-methyltransferase|uniref:23S rRNA (guanosine-2'-O-)-methyltransferase RlmB n=1 Tax=Dokdonella fugitiva TaxID=328517 RepID=A0A4R2I9E0_9GAMM|nr:23S rRNA (guanosine(2251)-2'-O)-methyltransferase RlmB [Dokdonella fugitiva]MBA8884341.1 23S rRNA (guanosine2251-2'-O)-methyltransferase [Dokdonella fugitiva]TCO39948.1 23S rRNA (guanosine2251-2'-O)-methyltransferase [Dokdonella fugitiva]
MSHELLIGIHAVEAALNHDVANLVELYIESGSHNARVKELGERARELGVKPHARDRAALDRMTGGARHQGVVARYNAPAPLADSALPGLVEQAGRDALFLVLDGITDPHNFGACLRSAEAAGVTAVLVPKDRAVGVTPTVRRASAGAADRVPIVAATNLARALKALKDAGVWLVGLAGDTDQSVYAVDLDGPIALVLGSEGEGMRRLTRENCDFVARIPMRGDVESLNVSVATGIVLFEALRQRSAKR